MYKVEFKGLTGVLKKIFCILGLSLREPFLVTASLNALWNLTRFCILRQDFWAHHVISISNQREPFSHSLQGCPRGVMVKAMDCGIVVREFVLQSRYYVHFRENTLGKGMNPLIPQLWAK